mgnify:CR=1 FL=1
MTFHVRTQCSRIGRESGNIVSFRDSFVLQEHWPRSIRTNGYIMLDGEKSTSRHDTLASVEAISLYVSVC